MNLRRVVLLFAFTVLTCLAHAQVLESAFIKVLPGPKPGIIKVMYAMPTKGALYVKFYRDGKLIKKDLIRGFNFNKGFIKSYDVSSLPNEGSYEVRITSGGLSADYLVEPSENGGMLSSVLIRSSLMNLENKDRQRRSQLYSQLD